MATPAPPRTRTARSLEAYPGYVHALAGLANVDAARQDYDKAIELYRDVTTRYPIPDYVIALGDIYAAAGKPEQASRQYALVGAIDQLYRANGVNTDLADGALPRRPRPRPR